jgi:hypothetical protein
MLFENLKPKGESYMNNTSSVNGSWGALEADGPSATIDSTDVVLKMHLSLFEHGRERPRNSGTLEPKLQDQAELTAHAEAMARELASELVDPAIFLHDKLRQDEFDRDKKEREELAQDIFHARADIRSREEELARIQSSEQKPSSPTLLMYAAGIVLAITVAPTLHDFIFFTLPDDLLRWFLSLASSAVIGLFIAIAILGDIDSTGKRTTANWLGLVGGFLIFIGLGILRIASATSWGEILFAIAMTIVELGIIGMLEWRAAALRSAYQDYAVKRVELDSKTAFLEAARTHHARLQELLDNCQKAITDYITQVEKKAICHLNIEAIVNSAKKSVLDGYNAGIAENRGRQSGATQSFRN